MDWKGGRRSSNVQDRRGAGMKAGGIGLGGIVIVLIGLFFGVDLNTRLGFVQGTGGTQQYQQQAAPADAKSQEQAEFVRVVLRANQDHWQQQFKRYGLNFCAPTLWSYSAIRRKALAARQAA